MDRLSQLPQSVVHNIQSFMHGKEAVLTALISKSWYHSWLTRPNLDFDFDTRGLYSRTKYIYTLMKKTMKRYRDSELNIESFKLRMDVLDNNDASSIVVEALNMGVSNLNIEAFGSVIPHGLYILPKEVFEAESLKSLSVTKCRIDGISGENVKCSRLESLSLSEVFVENDRFCDIIHACPLLENLYLYECDDGLVKVDMSKTVKLKTLSVIRLYTKYLYYQLRRLKKGGCFTDCLTTVPIFHNLSHLVLEHVEIDSSILHDFSRKFPCIEGLTIRHYYDRTRFNLSSHSLKYLTLEHYNLNLGAKVDAPKLLKFKYLGSDIPPLSLTKTSTECECDIEFALSGNPNDLFFSRLNTFLTHLSGLKISLTFYLFSKVRFLPSMYFQDLIIRPTVEYLTLKPQNSTSLGEALLDVILWSIRPKFITQSVFPPISRYESDFDSREAENELVELLCKKLMAVENGKGSSSIGGMACWNELKEVHAESFDDNLMEWRNLTWKTLLDELSSPKKEVQIRFKLGEANATTHTCH